MNNINDKIYLISMYETLINNNNQTDIGDYALEYETTISLIDTDEKELKDSTLALSTRLRKKENDEIVWGNIFHKVIIEKTNPFAKETMEEIESTLNKLHDSTEQEKIEFILRNEKHGDNKPFIISDSIDPRIAGFFKNLQENKKDYPLARLGGRFPREIQEKLDEIYDEILEKSKL